MKHDAAQQFGAYIKRLRTEQKLSMRGLAHKANIDSGALTRIEQGKVDTPQPDTLKALAEALQVPLADMFAMAGYVIPYDLPSLTPYLQARYSHLPEETLASANDYLQRLIDEHGLDPNGPVGLEDETKGQH
ncbi:MAG: helix-turn-helix domain-containing protein [Pseudonocardiaceae bacterium]